MEILSLIGLLTIFPFGATIIGLICIGMYFKKRARFALAAGITWIIYSIYEYLMYTRVLCTGECNIRIDLLIIYPVLFLLLLATAVSYFRIRSNGHGKA